MLDLAYSFKLLTNRNRDGSINTQHNREDMLALFARQWHDLGFTDFKKAEQMSGRHVNRILAFWQSEGLGEGTLKNRMAVLRWVGEKVGRSFVFAKDNANYGIAERTYSTNDQSATPLDRDKWAKINDGYVQASLELVEAFGLRREEAIKFRPSYACADGDDHIKLKASWCKGGRERTVPVRTQAQRDLLDRLHRMVGKGSLIPPDKRYIDQRKAYDTCIRKVGIRNPHAIRHHYAQRRYQELTGHPCPKAGGKTSRQMTTEERAADQRARLAISEELGHSREQITVTYLGR